MNVAFTIVVLLTALGHALPMDPRRKPVPDVPNVQAPQAQGVPHVPPPRIPDTPGLNSEEYNRYWREMARADPGRAAGCLGRMWWVHVN